MKIQTLTTELRKLTDDLEKETIERAAIKSSQEYLDTQNQIEELTAKQGAMLTHVCDSLEAYEDVKDELIEEFNKQNLEEYGGVKANFRKSNKVNCYKVLQTLDGDLDAFNSLASIPQKALKDFAKIEGNKAIKKDLYSCIEETGKKITDFEIN